MIQQYLAPPSPCYRSLRRPYRAYNLNSLQLAASSRATHKTAGTCLPIWGGTSAPSCSTSATSAVNVTWCSPIGPRVSPTSRCSATRDPTAERTQLLNSNRSSTSAPCAITEMERKCRMWRKCKHISRRRRILLNSSRMETKQTMLLLITQTMVWIAVISLLLPPHKLPVNQIPPPRPPPHLRPHPLHQHYHHPHHHHSSAQRSPRLNLAVLFIVIVGDVFFCMCM